MQEKFNNIFYSHYLSNRSILEFEDTLSLSANDGWVFVGLTCSTVSMEAAAEWPLPEGADAPFLAPPKPIPKRSSCAAFLGSLCRNFSSSFLKLTGLYARLGEISSASASLTFLSVVCSLSLSSCWALDSSSLKFVLTLGESLGCFKSGKERHCN